MASTQIWILKVFMEFKAKILHHIHQAGTQLCIGIDPPFNIEEMSRSEKLPDFFLNQWNKKGHIDWLEQYSFAILEAAHGIVPAVKPQSAYFEAAGYQGYRVLEHVIAKARQLNLLTILDVKRGDISTTMHAYGQMAFESLNADCMTVTAYMGTDVVRPLIPWIRKGRGVYVVWISSNPSGIEIQNLCATQLIHSLQKFCDENNLDQGLGLVYGATKLEHNPKWSNEQLQNFYLLMPGIGPQGGRVTESFCQFLSLHPSALIPQSRLIGQLRLQPGEHEPRNWDDFSELVVRRIRRSIEELQYINANLIAGQTIQQ
jgi:orotidine-5'-phosphate decarboxylase